MELGILLLLVLSLAALCAFLGWCVGYERGCQAGTERWQRAYFEHDDEVEERR